MITSTTTDILREGKLFNIPTLVDYLKNQCKIPYTVNDIYGENGVKLEDDTEYSYISEGMYNNIKTYFIAIKCGENVLLIETDKKLSNGGKVVDVHKVNLTDENVETFIQKHIIK